MYIQQLQAFLCAADCGSFSKAADRLFNTPASVMNQINALEKQVGVRLLERNNHGISLTAAGRSFYSDAQSMLKLWEETQLRAREAARKEEHIIRVGTSLLYPCKKFMELWGKLKEDDPEFRIEIVPFEDNHAHILSTLSNLGRNIDILVGACSSAMWLDRCSIYPLGTYKICCAVHRGHALAKKAALKINDLYGERLMMVKRGDTAKLDVLRDMLEREHPQIYIEDTPYFYDAEVFNKCHQDGCILLSLDAWSDVHPGLVTLPVDWDYSVEYGLLYSKHPSRSVLLFLEALAHS